MSSSTAIFPGDLSSNYNLLLRRSTPATSPTKMISSGGIFLRRQSRPSSYCPVRFSSHKLARIHDRFCEMATTTTKTAGARVSEERIVETFHNDDDEVLDAAENEVVDKKNRFYIVSALADTKVDLKVLSQRLGLGKGGLRMTPEEALSEILQEMGCTNLVLHVQLFVTLMVILAGTFCAVGDTDIVDVAAISSLYVALGSPPLLGWKPVGGDPCFEMWQGVGCVFSNITSIRLDGLNLGGELGSNLNFPSILEMKPYNNVKALFRQGKAHMALHNIDAAVESFKNALVLEPNDARRSALWVKLVLVTVHLVYIGVLFLIDGDLIEKTKKEPMLCHKMKNEEGPKEDPRLELLRKEWFEDKECLDI
ncbi:hypothetical protein Ahy_B02g057690 [Arachis hypogaea]|uniref:YbaK/aminoacyl-tRNA synthetase-associated domain-containing protein n=3 Tax=Arachis hypogaea TaxID=3818 RepID=A0A445ACM1_ARAHY|nr:hypothetical protein Ahy_B02g057690 [Arachis hypogaea]